MSADLELDKFLASGTDIPGLYSQDSDTDSMAEEEALQLLKLQVARPMQSAIWKVRVTKPHESYYVHEELIESTLFFNNMIKNDWQEVKTKEINLEEYDVKVVAVLMDCLYDREISIDRGSKTLEFVVDCYEFAYYFGYYKMRNKLVEAYQTYLSDSLNHPTVTAIAHLDAILPEPDCPLRYLVRDIVVWDVLEDMPSVDIPGTRASNFCKEMETIQAEDEPDEERDQSDNVAMVDQEEIGTEDDQTKKAEGAGAKTAIGGGEGLMPDVKDKKPIVTKVLAELLARFIMLAGTKPEERMDPKTKGLFMEVPPRIINYHERKLLKNGPQDKGTFHGGSSENHQLPRTQVARGLTKKQDSSSAGYHVFGPHMGEIERFA